MSFCASSVIGALLAHQGGWDEIALVGGPIVLIIAVLAVAKRRVDRSAAASDVPESALGDRAGSRERPSET